MIWGMSSVIPILQTFVDNNFWPTKNIFARFIWKLKATAFELLVASKSLSQSRNFILHNVQIDKCSLRATVRRFKDVFREVFNSTLVRKKGGNHWAFFCKWTLKTNIKAGDFLKKVFCCFGHSKFKKRFIYVYNPRA